MSVLCAGGVRGVRGGGLVNSGAYVLQHAFNRALGGGGNVHTVMLDHHRALELVARESSRLILLDRLSVPFAVSDPAVMLGGKRVLVASGYEEAAFPPNPGARHDKELWRSWEGGGFADEALARRFAARADLLIATPRVASASWRLLARLGEIAVYGSTLRGTAPEPPS